jgi:chitin disaccharide deacetylase
VKYLVTNADDFGFTPDVNEGIVEAHCNGILTATTLMANGEAFDDATRLARQNPTLDIGCHLVLVGGHSLVNPERMLPTSTSELTRQVFAGRIDIYDELEAQVQRILAAGIVPTHLDTHKHTHLLPPIFRAVCAIAENFRIKWVRRPIDFDGPSVGEWKQRCLGKLIRRAAANLGPSLRHGGLKHTDHFWGFSVTGKLDEATLLAMVPCVPKGSTELMVHPGRLRAGLAAAPTRLKQSRELELKALVSQSVRDAVAAAGIRLVNYRQLNEL